MSQSAFDEYPEMLNADQLAKMLGISRAGAYQLLNCESFPTLRIGKRKIAPKSKVLQWIDERTSR